MKSKTATRGKVWILAVAIGLLGQVKAGSPPEMTLRLYDYAQTPQPAIVQMKGETEWIFSKLGVRVAWMDCRGAEEGDRRARCLTPVGPSELVVRITQSTSRPQTAAISQAVINGGWTSTGSRMVTVSLNSAEKLAAVRSRGLGKILACLVAHEIGHVFGLEHSPVGIMKAHLTAAEVQPILLRQMVFLSSQKERLRAGIASRLEIASTAVLPR